MQYWVCKRCKNGMTSKRRIKYCIFCESKLINFVDEIVDFDELLKLGLLELCADELDTICKYVEGDLTFEKLLELERYVDGLIIEKKKEEEENVNIKHQRTLY